MIELPPKIDRIVDAQGWDEKSLLQHCINFLVDECEPELTEAFVDHLKNAQDEENG